VQERDVLSKTNITVELANGGWAVQEVDTIAHDGGYWLVPSWTLSADGTKRQPVRMISLTMAETGAPATEAEAFVGLPIPETILSDGHVPLSRDRLFLVRECPDVWVAAG
jgi:hypothetical protein